MAPVAATAAELNVNGVSEYSNSSEVQGISQFSDVYPTDWAYQALTNLAERHGCVAAAPSGSMTRYEAAALLNKCLSNVAQVNQEERRLLNEFGPELAVIEGRINGLEDRVGEFEAGVFSATTKLTGNTTFVIGGIDGGSGTDAASTNEATQFNYDTILNLDSSFTGDDLLRTSLRASNFRNDMPFADGTASLERGWDGGDADAVYINRNFYQFPIGDDLTATVGARVRQDDMLGVWPSAYPSDSILDVHTYAGANDTYNLAIGAGAGLTYEKNNVSASFLIVSDEPNDANEKTGGVLTEGGSDDYTAQLAYLGQGWTLAVAYTNSDGGLSDSVAAADSAERYDAWGVSGVYEIDADSAWIPSSVSAGVGWRNQDKSSELGTDGVDNTADDVEDTSTWTIGLLWNDAFVDGNTLGVAYGTAEGHRDDSGYDDPMSYEVFYSMAVSDNITVTPAIFQIEKEGTDEVTGALVKTTFKF